MGTSNYLQRYLSEITALRAFEAGALDYSLMNDFAIGSVLAPKRGQKRSVFWRVAHPSTPSKRTPLNCRVGHPETRKMQRVRRGIAEERATRPQFFGIGPLIYLLWAVLAYVLFRYWPVQAGSAQESAFARTGPDRLRQKPHWIVKTRYIPSASRPSDSWNDQNLSDSFSQCRIMKAKHTTIAVSRFSERV